MSFTVKMPPVEVMVAVLEMRSNAASPALVLVRVMLPPRAIAEVLSNAWLLPESARVAPFEMVVAPDQPPADVPFNVRTPAVLPLLVIAMEPEPVTAPVMVAAAILLSVITEPFANVRVLAPVLIE